MSIPLKISEQYNLLSGEELKLFEERLLEQYLDGKMTPEEKEWFENILLDKYIENDWGKTQTLQINKHLDNNQKIKEKYQTWINAATILNNKSEETKIRNLISEQLKEVEIPSMKRNSIIIQLISVFKNNKNYQNILLAASIIILISVSITIWYSNKQFANNDLYAMYYEPYKLDFEITRDSLPSNEYIIKAQKAFLNEETENTIKYIEQAINENPENLQLYLNLGSIYMVTEEYEKAIPIYDKLPPDAGYYYETAKWYMGLCYLKTGQEDKAVEVFTKLKDKGKYYTEKTTDILNKINL